MGVAARALGRIGALVGVYYWTLRRNYGSLMEGAQLFEDMRKREEQALELNDNVLQGLVVAKMSLDLGDQRRASEALETAIGSASHMITDLLGPDRSGSSARLLRGTAAVTAPHGGPGGPDAPADAGTTAGRDDRRHVTGAVRAVIVDDTPDLRLLLRLTLERDGDISIVGEAEDGLQGIEAARRLQPQLVMLDLAMPVMDGLEALPRIKAACPSAKVVVLSGFEAGAMQERSMRAGADAYVQKGTPPREILALVRALLGRDGGATATVPSARHPEAAAATPTAASPVAPRARPSPRPAAACRRRDGDRAPGRPRRDDTDGNGVLGYANAAARRCSGSASRARRHAARRAPARRPLAAAVGAAEPQPARTTWPAGVHDRMIGGAVPWTSRCAPTVPTSSSASPPRAPTRRSTGCARPSAPRRTRSATR